jgi:mediator of RNA polymerase II transcription subunit 24
MFSRVPYSYSVLLPVENLNLLLVVATAEGKLRPLLKAVVKCNQRCQESLNETVKNSLLRAALFDLTFLMLAYSVQCFSAEVM